MYFQVPIITSSGTYLGELVDKYKIGKTIKCCEKDIGKVIFSKLDNDIYLADNDYIKLEIFLKKDKSE